MKIPRMREAEWGDDIASGYLQGLVISEELRRTLGIDSPCLEPFAPGFRWIPYQGTEPC